ncbi:hypothetical protein BJV82DRAFT_590728 [Fennellomyces sp. T-0311]|nr:hypothetical protein BJV82DRAFT_590728 [Fennellomyces sp. T-0311]
MHHIFVFCFSMVLLVFTLTSVSGYRGVCTNAHLTRGCTMVPSSDPSIEMPECHCPST